MHTAEKIYRVVSLSGLQSATLLLLLRNLQQQWIKKLCSMNRVEHESCLLNKQRTANGATHNAPSKHQSTHIFLTSSKYKPEGSKTRCFPAIVFKTDLLEFVRERKKTIKEVCWQIKWHHYKGAHWIKVSTFFRKALMNIWMPELPRLCQVLQLEYCHITKSLCFFTFLPFHSESRMTDSYYTQRKCKCISAYSCLICHLS